MALRQPSFFAKTQQSMFSSSCAVQAIRRSQSGTPALRMTSSDAPLPASAMQSSESLICAATD